MAAFGAAIDRRAWKAVIPEDRTDVDDLAAALTLENRQHTLAQEKHAFQVGGTMVSNACSVVPPSGDIR